MSPSAPPITKNMSYLRPFMILAAFLITGCQNTSLTPDNASDTPKVSAARVNHQTSWWLGLNDPLLTQRVAQLQWDNLDIQQADSRLREARALRSIAQADLLPKADLSAGANRGNRRNIKTGDVSDIGFDATWEIDLFGKTRSAIRAAEARVDQASATRDNSENTVIAELARAVVEWRSAQERIRILTQLVQAQETQIELYTARQTAGLINATFAERAKAARAQAAAQLPLAKANADTARFQIEVLLGMPPNSLKHFFETESPKALVVPDLKPLADQSIETIRNRPDIRAARAALEATKADVASAEAALWPSLSLGSFFGLQSVSAGSNNPAWQLSISTLTPLLRFGQLREAIRVANERQQQAWLAYHSTSLQALQEIQTALSDYTNGTQAIATQQAALTQRETTVTLVQERFNRGLSDMIDLTTAQTELETTSQSLLDLKTQTTIAFIRLQKALAQ